MSAHNAEQRKIIVGVFLGKKDRLVRAWHEILPKGNFPILVKLCMRAYLKGQYFPLQIVCDPRELKEELEKDQQFVPQRNITFTPEDGPVYQWIQSLETGYRSEEIKEILKETIVQTLGLHPFKKRGEIK